MMDDIAIPIQDWTHFMDIKCPSCESFNVSKVDRPESKQWFYLCFDCNAESTPEDMDDGQ